jgi:hypothetical protein
MTGAANRRRGADAERAVVNYLKAQGFTNARRVLAGDGHQHSDIDGIPGVSIEVKDRTSSSWPAWRLQAVTQARPGDTVIVVRRVRGVTDVGQWEAHILEDDWWTLHVPRCDDRACSLGNHLIDITDCPRTGQWWCRLTFADIVELLNAQQSERTPPPA